MLERQTDTQHTHTYIYRYTHIHKSLLRERETETETERGEGGTPEVGDGSLHLHPRQAHSTVCQLHSQQSPR